MRCAFCDSILTWNRHGLTKYCDANCYYEAKKIRSKQRYSRLINQVRKIENEKILEHIYSLTKSGISVPINMLEALQFNWDFTDDELEDAEGKLYWIVGGYIYTILDDNSILIDTLQ